MSAFVLCHPAVSRDRGGNFSMEGRQTSSLLH